MNLRIMLVFALSALCVAAWSARVITEDFGSEQTGPFVQITGDAKIADGVLVTAPLPNWQRSGVSVGPLPLGDGTWTVQYDFQQIASGNQCQSFVSQTPSTHHYMVYVRPGGGMNVHLRHEGEWKQRASWAGPIKPDRWYTVRVTLTHASFQFAVREKGADEDLWDTGTLPMDDLGQETTCALVDEAPTSQGGTRWDNLTVDTDREDVITAMQEQARRIAEERRLAEQQAEACAKLAELGIALIPFPQRVTLAEGAFDFAPDTVIIPDPNHPDRMQDVEIVRGVLKERLDLELGVGTDGPAGALILSRPTGERPADWEGDQGYRIEVLGNSAEIIAGSPRGFFYGAQTLCQLASAGRKLPQCTITDWPAIESRLVMIAVSQGAFKVIDVDYWKRVIRELAAVKITHIMPYFEGGTFYYEKYPFLGIKGRDGFTIEKGKELSDYAKEHFISLVPQQEALGHSGNVLTHEELKDLRESGGVFCSSNPRTFEFLGDLFDELVQAFPHADAIHVGGDEFLHGFAKCDQCKARAAEIGPEGLYAEHLEKLREMLAARDRKMMIWWHEEGFTEKAGDRLSKDIAVFDWHYGNQASYPSLKRLQDLGFPTWATPAVTRYYGGGNDWQNTFGNIRGFLTEGARRQVPGECTCTWVHGIWGGRNLFELNLYGVVFSANCAWNPLAAETEDFAWRFGRQWFGLESPDLGQQVMDAIHTPFGEPGKQGFWANNRAMDEILGQPLSKLAETLTEKPEMVAQAKELEGHCRKARSTLEAWLASSPRNAVTAEFYLHDVHIHETVARLILAVDSLVKSYAQARQLGFAELPDQLTPELQKLRRVARDLETIEAMYQRSILEAGGGPCGWGGWFPYVASGGVQFRAPQAKAQIEAQIKHLERLINTGNLPEQPWSP